MNTKKKALIVIDVQNDYFPGGKLPLWHANETLNSIVRAIRKSGERGIPVILVRHSVVETKNAASFFIAGSHGADLHPGILEAAPDARIVVKHHTDSFKETDLNTILRQLSIDEIMFCGMQTQNCVGLTAISRHAGDYKTEMLSDCCTAETETVHRLALSGFSDIVTIRTSETVFA